LSGNWRSWPGRVEQLSRRIEFDLRREHDNHVRAQGAPHMAKVLHDFISLRGQIERLLQRVREIEDAVAAVGASASNEWALPGPTGKS